jgi:hypothetical protein
VSVTGFDAEIVIVPAFGPNRPHGSLKEKESAAREKPASRQHRVHSQDLVSIVNAGLTESRVI